MSAPGFLHLLQCNSRPASAGRFSMIMYSYGATGTRLFRASRKLGSGDICHGGECAECWESRVVIFWRGKHKYKISKREGGGKKKVVSEEAARWVQGEKLNWLSRALVKNENQSAGPLFTPISAEIARNIDISIYKCTVLFRSHAALCRTVVPKCTDRISFHFFFFLLLFTNPAGSAWWTGLKLLAVFE